MSSRQPPNAAAGSSRTITLTATHPDLPPSYEEAAGILRLRPQQRNAEPSSSSRRVVWTENTVDNEGLGRKKSKICCIYHKPKAFDESSDESSSGSSTSDTDSESSELESDSGPDGDRPNLSQAVKEKMKQKSGHAHHHHHHHHGHAHHHHHGHQCDEHRHGKPKKSKTRGSRSSAGTQTITEQPKPAPRNREEASEESSGEEGFRPNAYERGPK